MPVIPATQENEAERQGVCVPAWATEQDPVSKNKTKNK
jgi:hypothetical protein